MTGMDSTDPGAARAARGRRADKAGAIAHAACVVFGRDGYWRAGIDGIATEAGVSTRTIYNHFPGGKEELFRWVMEWSSGRVRDEQVARLHRYLDPQRPPHPRDLERDLLALADSWANLTEDFRDHFLMVRHIFAEVGHVPPEVLTAWQEAGPRAVARELAAALAALAAQDLLDLHGDADQAAAHFTALITAGAVQLSSYGISTLPPEQTGRLVAAGVRAFLRAYGGAAN